MTVLRRVAIVIVALLFVADATAWGLVQLSGPGGKEREEATKSDVVAFIDNKSQARLVARAIKDTGIKTVDLKPDKRTTTKTAGYQLVLEVSGKEIASPIAETLKGRGYPNIKISEDGTKLMLGGLYQSKAKAKAVADRVERDESFKFKIEAGTKEVSIDTFKLTIKHLDKENAKIVTDILIENNVELFDKVETEMET